MAVFALGSVLCACTTGGAGLIAGRVVQGVGAGVAPMSIQIVLGQCRARTGKLEELVGGKDRNFCCQNLGLRGLDGSLVDILA